MQRVAELAIVSVKPPFRIACYQGLEDWDRPFRVAGSLALRLPARFPGVVEKEHADGGRSLLYGLPKLIERKVCEIFAGQQPVRQAEGPGGEKEV